jgi:shikimate dehydrogenase
VKRKRQQEHMSFCKQAPEARALLIGKGLQHSQSPAIHKVWMSRYGISGDYKTLELEGLEEFFENVKVSCIRGVNVTMPYKEVVMGYLDSIDSEAKQIGAVNTIINQQGKLHGINTDYYGVVASLRRFKFLGEGSSVLVIGSGGAAQVVVFALIKRGCKQIYIASRNEKKRQALKKKYTREVKTIGLKEVPLFANKVDLVVNATPLGMSGYNETLLISLKFKNGGAVFDLVYNPSTTGLIRAAKEQNVDCCNGLLMLYTQAARSFYSWFGIMPELERV